jgi:hypothetical protein
MLFLVAVTMALATLGTKPSPLVASSLLWWPCHLAEGGPSRQQAGLCLNLENYVGTYRLWREPLVDPPDSSPQRGTVGHHRWYSGLYLSQHLSFHAQGSLAWFAGDQWQREHIDELAFLQIGHPLFSPVNISVGRINLPFGLDYRVVSETLQRRKQNFWPLYTWGAAMTVVNHDQTHIEWGASSTVQEPQLAHLERHKVDTVSLRISKDYADLEGTKLIASTAHKPNQETHFGISALNKARGRITSFEWVRRIYHHDQKPFSQLFRINHLGRWSQGQRWYYEYENVRAHSWLGTIGSAWQLGHKSIVLNSELAYASQRGDASRSGWIMTVGLRSP